jgi:sulfatase maturation enzyme AslB (radical SAM superfamily)
MSEVIGSQLIPEMVELIRRPDVFGIVCTVDEDGQPRCAPFASLTAIDDRRLALASLPDNHTLANIRRDERVTVLWADADVRISVIGRARVTQGWLATRHPTGAGLARVDIDVQQVRQLRGRGMEITPARCAPRSHEFTDFLRALRRELGITWVRATPGPVASMDFHVTSECNQECPYCWGPQDIEEVDTETAKHILLHVAAYGAQRVVFTGGDPLKRRDIGELVRFAKDIGLEVALSATGDELTEEFLAQHARDIDLISLPIDGSSEEVSSQTKKEGHFTAIMRDLEMLARYPQVDVKLATPVTKKNIADVPNIVRLIEGWAEQVRNRVFYNVFHAFPRSMVERGWDDLLVTGDEYAAMQRQVEAMPHRIKINFLTHQILDRVYVMIFPDGTLTIPTGPDYRQYGRFLDVHDLESLLAQTDFDAAKHHRHAKGWRKAGG